MSVAPPPTTADQPLVNRLLSRWARIAERMLADGLGATPPAADLPPAHFRPEVLPAIHNGSSGVALLPVRAEPEPDPPRHAGLAAELAEQFGVPAYVTESRAVPRARLPLAAEEVTELGALARLLGHPTGHYGLDDLLLEYQLTRPGPARDRLAERMTPLLRAPHLLEALRAHLRHGSDRRAAATALHVHPNTYTYRLRRVAELTGMDPADPHDSRLLAASLTIHHLYPSVPDQNRD